MKTIVSFMKNRIVISLIGLIALSIIVWFVGPLIKFGAENTAPLQSEISRLIVIIILLVLWGLNNLRIQLSQNKSNSGFVGDLEQNHRLEIETDNGQVTEEATLIQQRFADALSTISKLKFKGKTRSRALYQLPWYIIIGPPGSGKTTALVNSSLEFPLAEQFGMSALQGVGGTRNCDWWFTNEAVLIDTAGRYTTQDSHRVNDSSAWESFLKLLKKNRRRRPLNGVLVAISVHDLLFQNEHERAQHAKVIRTRIDELMQKLEVRFPVYLVFTKTDLLSGFSEFFEDLSKEEREQVWGISLPNASDPTTGPDLEYYHQEFDKLVGRLHSRALSRMHQERDVKRRGLIQGFPQQLENCQSILSDFLTQTFVKNRFDYQPYLRGVYFTSGTQLGMPIDRLMNSVSAAFGFGQQNIAANGEGKSYFLGNLFREVIFPESELVGSNRKFELFIRWFRTTGYAALFVLAVGLIAGWIGSLSRHNSYMTEVNSYVDEFEQENSKISSWNKDIRVVVPALNSLANASIVYDQESHPWLSGLGLYDSNLDVKADQAYQTQLKNLLLPRLLEYLEKRVAMGHEGGDLYHNFRVYLMFNKLDRLDHELVSEWFVSDWKQTMSGEASSRQALQQHLNNLLKLEIAPADLNQKLVSQTRQLLLRVPVHQRIYSRIRTTAEFRQKVNMLNLFGESVRETFEVNDSVEEKMQLPFMFTREGYDSIDFSTNSPVIADIVNERWVLSDDNSEKVDFVENDLDEISEKVEALYFAEFIKHWLELLKSLQLAKFTSVDQAADVLSKFVDPVYSPLQAILQVTAENTQLSSQLLQNLNDDQGEGNTGKVTAALAEQFKGTLVDQEFRSLNVLIRDSKQKPAPIKSINQRLNQLSEFLNEVTIAPDPQKKAFEIALARYKQGAANPITGLAGYSSKTPAPVRKWLDSLADETWKVILNSARAHINSEWKNQVYGFYREALSGRYPISSKAKNELALQDFSDFFKPKGKLDSFYLKYINPFIHSRKGWKNKSVDKRSLAFSKSVLAQIRHAQSIKSIFFRKDAEAPEISFQIRPYRLSKNDARFRLDVGEQTISYNHGPKFWKDLKWSASDENNRVRIMFEDLSGGMHQKSFEGPWAWLRLQDHASITKTQQANVYRVKYALSDNGSTHSMTFSVKAKSINNSFEKSFLASFRAPERL